jgi:hypothetical protein
MKIQVTLKHYRCFVRPATVDLANGFTSFVGINNAGKSAMMRFFLELRPLLSLLKHPGYLENSLRKGSKWPGPLHVFDHEEIFSNIIGDPIYISFDMFPDAEDIVSYKHARIDVSLFRNMRWHSAISIDNATLKPDSLSIDGNSLALLQNNHHRMNLSNLTF